jgi:putative nucleotidyltransferase with HDIG domain
MADEQPTTRIWNPLRRIPNPRDLGIKLAIAFLLVVLLALLFPRGEAIELDYKVGSVWARKDLIAPFSFPVFRDDQEYAVEVAEAVRNVSPVFQWNEHAVTEQPAALDSLMNRLAHAAALHAADRQNRPAGSPADTASFSTAASLVSVRFSDREWGILAGRSGRGGLRSLQTAIVRVMAQVLETGFIDREKDSLSAGEIAVRRGSVEERVGALSILDKKDVVALLEQELTRVFGGDNDTADLAYKIGIHVIRPNLLFHAAATNLAATAAVETVPRTIGFVQENERIVSKHERITPETKLKLESLRSARAERGPESAGLWQFLGIVLHLSIVLMLYGIYLYLFRKRIVENNLRLSLIALLILLQGAVTYLTRELNVTSPIEYLIIVPTSSMLLTIIFDSRVGFYGTVVIAFIVAGIRGNDYSIALASLVAGALSIYTVRDMKNRTQIFRSLGFIFLGYTLAILALALERFESAGVVLEQIVFGLTNAIVSPVLTYGLLIFIERVFRVTTDLTLIELAHFNHPLLRQLSERAPGTHHHSMTLASLCEAAAVAVGANEVLARVGAYFHDAGKIRKPTYFVENQKGSRNRHDKLSPRMSSLIIAAHVKDGIALAREHNLPQEVIDFIPMHHGTTRIEFFYSKALRLAENSPDETKIDEIKESDYRYPGPKPQTKETGILMLADAIEASARALDDPSPQKLEAMIDELIRRRFEEGELDECPLTLKDLTRIKGAFLGVLVGIHHSRIKYPEDAEQAAS